MDDRNIDERLVAASIAADKTAFTQLVERHYRAVLAVAVAVTSNVALAQDVAQQTFLVAWTHLHSLRAPERVRAWLCNTARNLSKNELRRCCHEVLTPTAPACLDPQGSVLESVIANESSVALEVALAVIPASHREALVLFYWEGLSIQRVATALEITEPAAQKRISRARAAVASRLTADLARACPPARTVTIAIAAIIALVGGPGATVSAAPRSSPPGLPKVHTLSRRALLLAAAGIVVAGGVVLQRAAMLSTVAAAPAPRAGGGSPQRAPASRPPTLPARSSLPRSSPSQQTDSKTNTSANGAGYSILVLSGGAVVVPLLNNSGNTYLPTGDAPVTIKRRIRGRVLEANRRPVAGAVVVIGNELRVIFGGMYAEHAATTDENGAFDVGVASEGPLVAMSLHPRAGWSGPVSVPAGRAVDLVLSLGRLSGLSGVVRRAGAPIQSELVVTDDAGHLELRLETDEHGAFAFPLLPAGSFRVVARTLQLFGGGTSRTTEQQVIVEDGRPSAITIDLPVGALLVASVRKKASATSLDRVEYVLVPGTPPTKDAATLRTLVRSGQAIAQLRGGQDAEGPMQFHDLAAGDYTLCIDARRTGASGSIIRCTPVTVPSGERIVEQEFDIE